LAFAETVNVLTERVDPSDDVPTESERWTPTLWMNPFAHQKIGERHASGENTEAHLADSGSRNLFFDDSQTLGTAKVAHNDPLIPHDEFRASTSVTWRRHLLFFKVLEASAEL
jgi:hypothetical protein